MLWRDECFTRNKKKKKSRNRLFVFSESEISNEKFVFFLTSEEKKKTEKFGELMYE